MTRQCKKCGEVKSLEEFIRAARCREGRTHECKSCATTRARRWRNGHAGGYLPPGVKERLRIRDEARGQPCADCGETFHPAVMQFDHVRGEKVANVAAMVYGRTTDQLRAEIAKCDVVCANCHCLRHWHRERESE